MLQLKTLHRPTSSDVEWWNKRSESQERDEENKSKCWRMREIIRLLKFKITKRSIHCKGNRWHNTREHKETRIWACVPVIAAWISSTMRPDPHATPAIHAVVVVWPSSPVGGAPQKDARCARPSSTIFTLTIVGYRTKLPRLRNSRNRDSNLGSFHWDTSVLLLIYRSPLRVYLQNALSFISMV